MFYKNPLLVLKIKLKSTYKANTNGFNRLFWHECKRECNVEQLMELEASLEVNRNPGFQAQRIKDCELQRFGCIK